MIEDMRVRNLAPNTQRAYLQQVNNSARHFGRSPELLGPEEVRAWQVHLTEVQRRSSSTLVVATAALRFLYHVTLKRGWSVEELPIARTPRKLPVILSQDEITRFLEAIRSVKQRTILIAAYAAGLATINGRAHTAGPSPHRKPASASATPATSRRRRPKCPLPGFAG
jgi:site-specific recombinase XerD